VTSNRPDAAATVAILAAVATLAACLDVKQPAPSNTAANTAMPIAAHERQIKLIGNAHLLIANARGQRIGYVGDALVDEIPNARYVEAINAMTGRTPEPTYLLPSGESFDIQLFPRSAPGNGGADFASISIFGGGMVFEVKRMPLHAGKTVRLSLDDTTTRFAVWPALGADLRGQTRVGAVVDAVDGADYDYVLTNVALSDGAALKIAFDVASGALTWSTADGRPVALDLAVTRVDKRGAASEFKSGITRLETFFGATRP
jgi:hypothetical protein